MKRLVILCATAAVALSPCAPAQAADDATVRHYVQCFLVMSALAASDDPKGKSAGLMATNFFAGQIFGAAPDIDLTAAFRREVPVLNDAKTQDLLSECGAEMDRRGSQIVAAGDALEADAAPAPSLANPPQ
jgi:hypothetical protein